MGFYLRPEAIYSHYKYTHSVTGERTLAQMGALLGTVGYQSATSISSPMHG
ncbi:MAG: hypothetical protein IKL29_01445 [Bacteroidaceae bacterium]|nr:hypothetical protein [Bacteroidaceae bacterium]